jgi:hypothetical protein
MPQSLIVSIVVAVIEMLIKMIAKRYGVETPKTKAPSVATPVSADASRTAGVEIKRGEETIFTIHGRAFDPTIDSP